MGNEYIIGRTTLTRQEGVKIKRVTFNNGNAAVQSIAFHNAGMPSSDAVFTLFASANTMPQFDFNGIIFSDGFTATPSSADINNIIIEYEDLEL